MKAPISMAVAAATILLILLGYFFPIEPLYTLRVTLLRWAVILAGFALVVGVLNLLNVHINRLRQNEAGSFNSLTLLVSLLATIALVGFFTPSHAVSVWIMNNVQLPLEASLTALLAVILLYAGIRLLRRRLTPLSIIFIVTAVVVLLGTAPLILIGDIELISGMRNYLVQVLSVGGARGILIGVALGTLATGVRVLIGSDRPYSG
jgi:hypothetical protein